MSDTSELLVVFWQTVKEYISAKDRQIAADHVVNELPDVFITPYVTKLAVVPLCTTNNSVVSRTFVPLINAVITYLAELYAVVDNESIVVATPLVLTVTLGMLLTCAPLVLNVVVVVAVDVPVWMYAPLLSALNCI